jgi:HD-GYP domain-containing protein (c-di-GMP phosphodiesterase class II)
MALVVVETDVIPISLATLTVSKWVELDLFIMSPQSGEIKLFRGSDYPIVENDLLRLRSRGVKQLYIKRDDRERYQNYLRNVAGSEAGDSPDEFRARMSAVNNVVRDVLESDFKTGDCDRIVLSALELGGMTSDLITHDQFAAADLLRVMQHDYATFTHSANVAFYAGMLAEAVGIAADEIPLIVAGGLLHDLGKLEIDERILCKPGRLDDEEFRIIRSHPTNGFRKLAHRDDLSEGQLMMVYQHHERLDGKGYPTGCVADDIHLWAKICAVVDVFEALTSHRPYRSPMPRIRALEVLARDCGTAFDPEILGCWESIIQSGSKA